MRHALVFLSNPLCECRAGSTCWMRSIWMINSTPRLFPFIFLQTTKRALITRNPPSSQPWNNSKGGNFCVRARRRFVWTAQCFAFRALEWADQCQKCAFFSSRHLVHNLLSQLFGLFAFCCKIYFQPCKSRHVL